MNDIKSDAGTKKCAILHAADDRDKEGISVVIFVFLSIFSINSLGIQLLFIAH